jgi:hypothetical protein
MDDTKSRMARKEVTKQAIKLARAPSSMKKLDNSPRPIRTRPVNQDGAERIGGLSRLGNSKILGKLMAKRSAKKKRESAGEEWSRQRRERPSTGKGVGY